MKKKLKLSNARGPIATVSLWLSRWLIRLDRARHV